MESHSKSRKPVQAGNLIMMWEESIFTEDAVYQVVEVWPETDQILVQSTLTRKRRVIDDFNDVSYEIVEHGEEEEPLGERLLLVSENRQNSEPSKRAKMGKDDDNDSSSKDTITIQTASGVVTTVPSSRLVNDYSHVAIPTDIFILILQNIPKDIQLQFIGRFSRVSKEHKRTAQADRVWKYMLKTHYMELYFHYVDYRTSEIVPTVFQMLDNYTSNVEKRGKNYYKRFFEFLKKFEKHKTNNLLIWTSEEYTLKYEMPGNFVIHNLSRVFQCGQNVYALFTRLVTLVNKGPIGNVLVKVPNNYPVLPRVKDTFSLDAMGKNAVFHNPKWDIEILDYDQHGFVFAQFKSNTMDQVYFYYHDVLTGVTASSSLAKDVAPQNSTLEDSIKRGYQCRMNDAAIAIAVPDFIYDDLYDIMLFSRNTLKSLDHVFSDVISMKTTGPSTFVFSVYPEIFRFARLPDNLLDWKPKTFYVPGQWVLYNGYPYTPYKGVFPRSNIVDDLNNFDRSKWFPHPDKDWYDKAASASVPPFSFSVRISGDHVEISPIDGSIIFGNVYASHVFKNRRRYHIFDTPASFIIDDRGNLVKFETGKRGAVHKSILLKDVQPATFDLVSCQVCNEATETQCKLCNQAYCCRECFNTQDVHKCLKTLKK